MRALLLWLAPAMLWSQALKPEKPIPLPVTGRLGHMAADVEGRRVFVTAPGNHSVEVVDADAGTVVHSISGLKTPQGVYFWPEMKRLYVADGEGDTVHVYDGASFAEIRHYDMKSDPDQVRFDPKEKEIFVGYGTGALAVLSAPLASKVGEIVLAEHPGAFQLEQNGPRIFVNVPGGLEKKSPPGHVTVIDRRTRSVTHDWPLEGATQNFPLALDEANHRMFVGCRRPAKLLVLSLEDGKQVASVDIAGDADDVFYDSSHKRIYVSGGAGAVSVIEQTSPDAYTQKETVRTAEGAATSLFVPEFKRLYVAVPQRKKQTAELLVFAVE